ncbi:MAG TPA: hypothetical protein VF814_07285 [Casimicrobiaceae bacterium]
MTKRLAALRRKLSGRAMILFVVCIWAVPATSAVADVRAEVHGVADAYAAPGIALAWGILRGADEASTQVVVRIVADPKVYATVSAVGKNPFSNREQALLRASPTAGSVDVRVPRTQYADFPRTELRFYGPRASPPADAPALTVFYLGVPDTTPEFATEAALNAYLADRIARARAGA